MSNLLDRVLALPKGSFVKLAYKKPMKMRKGQPQLYKVWQGIVRPGVVYDNIGVVKEGRADGTLPEENAGLPYGEWEKFPYTIMHNGNRQFRFTKTGGRTVLSHIVDESGSLVSWDDAKTMALASEFPKKDSTPSPIINVKEENITELAGCPVELM